MHEDFWKKYPPIPGFDCVKMKHDIQEQIYEETKGMSISELADYFDRRAAERAKLAQQDQLKRAS